MSNIIQVERRVSEKSENKFLSEYARITDVDNIIDFECEIHDENDNFLGYYVPGAVAEKFTEVFEYASKMKIGSDMRITSTGKNVSQATRTNVHGEKVDIPYTGVLGAFEQDAGERFRAHCRLTNFTKENFNLVYRDMMPLWNDIERVYKEKMPEDYMNQCNTADKLRTDWRFLNTPFTTVTVNNNFRTAYHRDAGDLIGKGQAWSIICTGWRDGKFYGNELVFPAYRIGFQMAHGDLLICNPHHVHGNLPRSRGERISFVCYIREKIFGCMSASEESDYGKKISEWRFFGNKDANSKPRRTNK